MEATHHAVRAHDVVDVLVECGVTHVIWLVDSESAFMYEALKAAEQAGRLRLIPVCREAETIPIALGLLIGGKRPLVLIQSTGFYDSGDSLRGQAIDLGLPLVLMLGYRGWRSNRAEMRDTAAIFLEPILDGYGIPHQVLQPSTVVPAIRAAFQEATDRGGPVALLVPQEWEA